MNFRPLSVVLLLLLPLAAPAADPADGELIFKAKCQTCHALANVQGLLKPKPPEQRPAHLTVFLKTHPEKLTEAEKEAVIGFLSHPGK